MHIGLKKILAFREWTPSQNFHGHEGLERFHAWNVRLRAAWASARPIAMPLQLAAAGSATLASMRARPHEAALLCGVVAMFFFNLPANYYYVVLALVPAIALRRAATAPGAARRTRDFIVFASFNAFWVTTLVVSRLWADDILYDYVLCIALAAFLVVWIAAWIDRASIRALTTVTRTSPLAPP
jgi:hypothetical protein